MYFTRVSGGAEGALHPPALPVQTAAVHEGDLNPQQRALTHQACDLLPAHTQVLICRTDKMYKIGDAVIQIKEKTFDCHVAC